jgi:methylenetetrahydrofolate reductase (NADPH)
MATTVGPTVSELLRNSRFEILPLDGIEDQVREHLPTDVKVTVTASPRKGSRPRST